MGNLHHVAPKESIYELVVPIIRPERPACIQLALKSTGAELMTVTETHRYGQEERSPLIYRSAEMRVCTSPRLRLELLAEETEVEDVVDAIMQAGVSQRARVHNDGGFSSFRWINTSISPRRSTRHYPAVRVSGRCQSRPV